MARKSIYKDVSREKKNPAKTIAIVLGAVIAFLLVFIIWCAVMFSGNSSYTDAVSDVTQLKIMLEEKEIQIEDLRQRISELEEQKRQLESINVQDAQNEEVVPSDNEEMSPIEENNIENAE